MMTATRPTPLEELRAELRGLWQIMPGLGQSAPAQRPEQRKGG
jgi:hypothetical protein